MGGLLDAGRHCWGIISIRCTANGLFLMRMVVCLCPDLAASIFKIVKHFSAYTQNYYFHVYLEGFIKGFDAKLLITRILLIINNKN